MDCLSIHSSLVRRSTDAISCCVVKREVSDFHHTSAITKFKRLLDIYRCNILIRLILRIGNAVTIPAQTEMSAKTRF